MLMMNSASNKAGGYTRGDKGQITNSKTLFTGKGKTRIRIDVENTGTRKGNIHIHYKNGRYYYDPKSKQFIDAPKSVNDLLEQKEIRQAISKGLKYIGE